MFSEKWKKEIIAIPNLLSLLRIALIPVYITVYLGATKEHQYLLAGCILSFSCLTDIADGLIARKCNMVTNTGKILDPLADKLTQFVLILSLSGRYPGLYPVLLLFLCKEFFQCGAFVFFMQKGRVLPGALFAGKFCTTVLFVSLILLVIFPQMHPNIVICLILTDTVFLLYSFGSYLAAYWENQKYLTDLKQD